MQSVPLIPAKGKTLTVLAATALLIGALTGWIGGAKKNEISLTDKGPL